MRLFVGLPVPPDIQDALQQAWKKVSKKPTHHTASKPSSWHVTVAFLDDVPKEQIEKLREFVALSVRHSPAGSFAITAFESFPSRNPQRIVATITPEFQKTWTMFVDGVRDLSSIISQNVDRKPWKPHISITRQLKDLKLSPWSEKIEPIIWKPGTLSIIKSTLTPSGSMYERLHDFSLDV
jgi:RNA 2',3'-cyclic 3'-phosphodiesterase